MPLQWDSIMWPASFSPAMPKGLVGLSASTKLKMLPAVPEDRRFHHPGPTRAWGSQPCYSSSDSRHSLALPDFLCTVWGPQMLPHPPQDS